MFERCFHGFPRKRLDADVKLALTEPFHIVPEGRRVQFRNPTFNLNFTALENPGFEF